MQEITVSSVQYTSFEQVADEDNGFLVRMSGVAKDYRSIALQADMFNSSKGLSFKNVVFSNLVKDKNNNIAFDLKFNIDPALLSYNNSTAISNTTPTTSNKAPQVETQPSATSSQTDTSKIDTTPVNTNVTTSTTPKQEGSSVGGNLENNTQQQ